MEVIAMTEEKTALDWANLPFSYIKTDFNIRFQYTNGKWGDGELCSDDTFSISIAAPALHYGQQAFEGLKAFETKDGRIVVFRPQENLRRMNHSAERIAMPVIPEELFLDGLNKVIKANRRFVPPYGTGASLYIRPLLIGTSERVGLNPADDYMLIIFVTPVGPYYKSGFTPVESMVILNSDRTAPLGTGDCKVGGNYAAALPGSMEVKKKGFTVGLYLDSKEKHYVDEFSTSNFIGIKGKSYVTPKSASILESITNKSLATLAEDMGYTIERRPIPVDELDEFDEVGAVGTAAIITPVSKVCYGDKEFCFGDCDNAGPTLTALYEKYRSIQLGESEDTYSWMYEVKE